MTAFATQELSIGSGLMASLANARLVPRGAVAMPAIFSRPAADVVLGSGGIAARGALATVLGTDLGPAVARGSRVTVYYGNQLIAPAGIYDVRDRDDDIETGMARLDLELATS